ncbi:DUF455-domain-containing protein [Mycena venus]|uniref:DUF455-domain-containing protein n=1 Tax=Mycena venus TaxID=2733690 RepID=A0A8H6WSU5_9AGAR|nr:DUF455-domain-containing protein [Mycena venus]
MKFLQISPFKNLLTHSRFLLTLRSEQGKYHSLILFRLSPASDAIWDKKAISASDDVAGNAGTPAKSAGMLENRQIYVMESTCPHLGADMSHAEIEEFEDTTVAVCPYDFDLRTGKSEMGIKTCTYAVEVKTDPQDDIEKGKFADPPPPPSQPIAQINPVVPGSEVTEPVVPTTNPPKTLMQWAVLILNTANPTLKVMRTREAVQLFRTGEARFYRSQITFGSAAARLKGRKSLAVMLHALANVEQWAIDLAWDIMARFGPSHPDLPPAFFSDFTKMALDESKHFSLLTSRLSATSPTTPYGSMPVHASLWESATITSHSLRSRLAIIHLVHEARGLDVNPGTIERFRRAGDAASVAAMEIIHADEVTHVTSGHRWFTWLCEREGNIDPVATFREEVRRGWRGNVKGPFNIEDREKAGLTPEFYEHLMGEMGEDEMEQKRGTFKLDSAAGLKELKDLSLEVSEPVKARVAVEYEEKI